MRIILGALLALTVIISFATATFDGSGGPRIKEERELTYCNCDEVSCSSMSYSYDGEGSSFIPTHGFCYYKCCMGSIDVEGTVSSGKNSGSKPKSKPKPKPKHSSKSKPKPKPKPKPKAKPHPDHEMSYSYTPAPTPLETIIVPDKCRCKKDFSDQMCAWCVNGSDKCVDESCIDKCCVIKECKCDLYTVDVCNSCADGDSCPDEECAKACCTGDDYSSNSNSGSSAVPKEANVTDAPEVSTGTEATSPAKQESPTMASVSSQSISSTGSFQSIPTALIYSLVAFLAGAVLMGIVISLRSSNDNGDRTVPLNSEYVWSG